VLLGGRVVGGWGLHHNCTLKAHQRPPDMGGLRLYWSPQGSWELFQCMRDNPNLWARLMVVPICVGYRAVTPY